jgi:hypothetical protein
MMQKQNWAPGGIGIRDLTQRRAAITQYFSATEFSVRESNAGSRQFKAEFGADLREVSRFGRCVTSSSPSANATSRASSLSSFISQSSCYYFNLGIDNRATAN